MSNIEKIEINGHYVWVDKDADCWYDTLPIGTKYLHKEDNYIGISEMKEHTILGSLIDSKGDAKKIYFQIIAASPELNLEGVPTYVEWLAEKEVNHIDAPGEKLVRKTFFIKGYQAAEKELPTWDDVKTVWKAGQEYWKTSGASITLEELVEQLKQSNK